MKKLIFCALAAATYVAPAEAKNLTTRVQVNGATFRVTQSGDTVSVAKKSLLNFQTIQLRDDMREAVSKATGCVMADEMLIGSVYQGRLECPASGATNGSP